MKAKTSSRGKKRKAAKVDYAKVFAERLRLARDKNGWSQGELGAKIGVSLQRISDYECNRKSPGLLTMARLGEALHVSLDWMVGIH